MELLVKFLKEKNTIKELKTMRGRACVFVLNPECVCAHLQLIVVSSAAAVLVLRRALVQVENRAEVAEITQFMDDKLLT